MQDFSDFKCPYIDKKEIWKMAEAFRKKYWPEGMLPINIEKIVEQRLKLNIEPKPCLLSDQDIDAYLRIDMTGIVVDEKSFMDERFANRLRFSYAHEIGHLLMHKDIYAPLPVDSTEEWMRFVLDVRDSEYGHFEYQANEFAGRLLVPREKLTIETEDSLKTLEQNGLLHLVSQNPDAVLSRIGYIWCSLLRFF
jgi:Zn-dependent peptidase ImmA (M78 family)